MSPSEFDLRAALREGEGDVPDAGRVIARASRLRYERKRRTVAISSGIAVAAVIVTGFTLLTRLGNGAEEGGSGGGVAASVPGEHVPAAGGLAAREPSAPQQTAFSRAAASAGRISCPTRLPQQALPGGGGTDQFGADEPLFSAKVAAMRICTYDGAGALASRRVWSGRDATVLAESLEAGSRGQASCATSTTSRGDLAIYAYTEAGAALRVVTVQLDCPWLATNGTAVRYETPASPNTPVLPNLPSPTNAGSPIKS